MIVGGGGHGREMLDIVAAINATEPTYEVRGVLAAEADEGVLARRGVRLLGDIELLAGLDVEYVLGIGMPWTRRSLAEKIEPYGRVAASLTHPSVTIGGDNIFAEGVILAAGARVTTNVSLGRHTHLNINAAVSHDCVVGDFVTLSPGALVNGGVTLEDDVFVGTGAIVIPGVRIGRAARIGAGAVVVKDVPPGVRATGVPARW